MIPVITPKIMTIIALGEKESRKLQKCEINYHVSIEK